MSGAEGGSQRAKPKPKPKAKPKKISKKTLDMAAADASAADAELEGHAVRGNLHRTASGQLRKHATRKFAAEIENIDGSNSSSRRSLVSGMVEQIFVENDGYRHGLLSFKDRLNPRNRINALKIVGMQLVVFIFTVCYMAGFGVTYMAKWGQSYWESVPHIESSVYGNLSDDAFKWYDLPGRPAYSAWKQSGDVNYEDPSYEGDTVNIKILPFFQNIDGSIEQTAEDHLGQAPGTSCYKNMDPDKMGQFLRYYGHQFKLNLHFNPNATSWRHAQGAYEVVGINYSSVLCFNLWEAHVTGVVLVLCTCCCMALAFIFWFLAWTGMGGSKTTCIANTPPFVAWTLAVFCFIQGCLSMGVGVAMARVQAVWSELGFPWFFAPTFGMLSFALTAHIGHVANHFHAKQSKPMLDNVAEGLWGRKVECGGIDGFTETTLGIELAKFNGAVVVKSVRGFAASKGALEKSIVEQGESEYRANNVQVGDVFLGVMCYKTITIRRAKTHREIADDQKILSMIDPDTLMFTRDADEKLRGKYINDDAYIMLGKDYRWVKKKQHKVYKWLTPHVDPSLDDAEALIREAIELSNDQDNKNKGPFWLITWRVNTLGIKEAVFPPASITGTEWDAFDYKPLGLLVEFTPNSNFSRHMGLDLYDLNPSMQWNGRDETEGVSILGTSGFSKSIGLEGDDIIVGINYVPLSKLVTAHVLSKVLEDMPLPYVLNVAKKTSTLPSATQPQDRQEFFETLLLFVMAGVSCFLLVASSGSTEWLAWNPGGRITNAFTSSPDYTIGLFFSKIDGNADVTNRHHVDALLDQVVWESDFLSTGVVHCKIATRILLFVAMVSGSVCSFALGMCLLLGIANIKRSILKRTQSLTCICMVVQGVLTLVALSVWTPVHTAIKRSSPNCIIQYDDLRGNHYIEWGDKDDHDSSFGDAVCLEKFEYGVAFQALVYSAGLAFFVFVDLVLAFTIYSSARTHEELAELAIQNDIEEMRLKKDADGLDPTSPRVSSAAPASFR